MDLIGFGYLLGALVVVLGAFVKDNKRATRVWIAAVFIAAIINIIIHEQDKANREANKAQVETEAAQKTNRGSFAKVPILDRRRPLRINAGKNLVTGKYGQNVFESLNLWDIKDNNSVSVNDLNGNVGVSAKVMGENGIVVEIIDNEWSINPERWDRNFDNTALEIIDKTGEVVFQSVMHSDEFTFQGKFYNPVDKVLVTFTREGTVGGRGAPPKLIKRMFNYPSSTHLHERVGE